MANIEIDLDIPNEEKIKMVDDQIARYVADHFADMTIGLVLYFGVRCRGAAVGYVEVQIHRCERIDNKIVMELTKSGDIYP